jgi:hypothetical protein
MKYLISFSLLVLLSYSALRAQTCNQPGALVSVKNSYRSHIEYLIFTFVKPHNERGFVAKAGRGPFIQTPGNNPIQVKGDKVYRISFPNSYTICDTKNYTVVPQEKIKDLKSVQQSDGVIAYLIGLDASARITSHQSYMVNGFHVVKLRIE